MKAVLLPLAFLLAAVSAQTTACAADYIVEACLGNMQGQLAACGSTDYECQCQQYTNMLTCFNNCPNDPRAHDYAGQKQIFCGYASQFPNKTTSKPVSGATASTSAATAAATTTGASATVSASDTSTATGSAASSSKTNSAADLALNAGGVLAAVAGVVVAVL